MGQTDQVKRVAPTEHVHLEMKQMYEDFNYEMLEGYWRHYEFESDGISVTDMRRFREYEAFLSMTHKVPVITTVLCSADSTQLRSELTEGINISVCACGTSRVSQAQSYRSWQLSLLTKWRSLS